MSQLWREIQETTEEIFFDPEIGTKVILTDDNGVEYSKSAINPDDDLKGMLFSESTEYDGGSGVEVLSDKPVISLPIRHLARVPKDGENWMIRVEFDSFSEELTARTLSGPPKKGKTIGFINLRLQKLSQN